VGVIVIGGPMRANVVKWVPQVSQSGWVISGRRFAQIQYLFS
jgi:hypothetical protein